MIVGTGVDSVEIERFSKWHTYSKKKLQRIFSPTEIEFCLKNKSKSSERFAARFAAKEAFYKAFSLIKKNPTTIFSVFRNIFVQKQNNIPSLKIDWLALGVDTSDYIVHMSITHSRQIATVFVIIEKN